MKVFSIVGARPNFMKIASIVKALRRTYRQAPGVEHVLVHTGQHYDQNMSRVFSEELQIPPPDIDLGVGSGPHGWQTAKMMTEFEGICISERPDLIVVVGDVNSTLASALVGAKMSMPVAHIEAGLRSFDGSMAEEINRVVTDAISTLLFTTSRDANANLIREGIPQSQIFFVGNVMIDMLTAHRENAWRSDILRKLRLSDGSSAPRHYGLVTLHRPSNVDTKDSLGGLLAALREVAGGLPLIFPVHPRTRKYLEIFEMNHHLRILDPSTTPRDGIYLIEPLGYLDFLCLMGNSRFVLTDSGGIQEETTALGVPCLTLRSNTERPVTVSQGTNVLVGQDYEKIVTICRELLTSGPGKARIPELWDGHAAERIVDVLFEFLGRKTECLEVL